MPLATYLERGNVLTKFAAQVRLYTYQNSCTFSEHALLNMGEGRSSVRKRKKRPVKWLNAVNMTVGVRQDCLSFFQTADRPGFYTIQPFSSVYKETKRLNSVNGSHGGKNV